MSRYECFPALVFGEEGVAKRQNLFAQGDLGLFLRHQHFGQPSRLCDKGDRLRASNHIDATEINVRDEANASLGQNSYHRDVRFAMSALCPVCSPFQGRAFQKEARWSLLRR